ncbi:MAG TPA: outer membrane lipid asymmetry maintenance protein MlaD, partial [Chromatiaceae bacterium]|nr:outer membrane lipid asymmetry maintenance protein MlaD [Chromatiaceae bacterium]
MKTSKTVEILVGAFVATALLALFFLAMRVSNLGSLDLGESYQVKVRFDNIGSLKEKAPVTIAGVEVGRVAHIGFDQERFQAVVSLAIQSRYDRIPDDSFAKILTAGLLGEQYVGLDPGGSETFLSEGSEIEITQSA